MPGLAPDWSTYFKLARNAACAVLNHRRGSLNTLRRCRLVCTGGRVPATSVFPPLPLFIDLTSFAGKKDSDFATMFDLKKRNSLTLTCGRETEEFRRVAVRRRTKGSASTADCRPSHSGKIHKGCSLFVFFVFVFCFVCCELSASKCYLECKTLKFCVCGQTNLWKDQIILRQILLLL